MHPTVEKALAGEKVSSAEIQAMGGYEAFDNAIKQAHKTQKSGKTHNSNRFPERKGDKTNQPTPSDYRSWFLFKVFAVVVAAPIFLMFACH